MTDPNDLTLERLSRLERKMEQRFDGVEHRLDSVEAALGEMVTHRASGQIGRATARARTQDIQTMKSIEQRLRALEERQLER